MTPEHSRCAGRAQRGVRVTRIVTAGLRRNAMHPVVPSTCSAGAVPMRCPCSAHEVAMQCPCSAHAVPMRCPCGAHAVPMRCPCGAHGLCCGHALKLRKLRFPAHEYRRCRGRTLAGIGAVGASATGAGLRRPLAPVVLRHPCWLGDAGADCGWSPGAASGSGAAPAARLSLPCALGRNVLRRPAMTTPRTCSGRRRRSRGWGKVVGR